MKTMNFYFVMALLAFSTVSCVENSGKYKALVAQRDSLQMNNMMLEKNNDEIIEILNEAEVIFQDIRTAENKVVMNMNGSDRETRSKKDQITRDMKEVKELLAANREKIFQLEEKLAKSGKNNTSLRATIERMKAELEVKDQMILALKDDLSKKDIRIEELNVAVTDLNSNVQELTAVNEAQEAKIEEQIKNINEVWYCIGNDKDLKDADILTGTGLFRSKKIFEKDFDKKIFVEADLRELKSIPIDAKKAKLLSKHPEGSFQINQGDDKKCVLEILDSEKFWSVSKYLVINI